MFGRVRPGKARGRSKEKRESQGKRSGADAMRRCKRIGDDATRRSEAEEDGQTAYDHGDDHDVDGFWKETKT